jgi:hypothetical protein
MAFMFVLLDEANTRWRIIRKKEKQCYVSLLGPQNGVSLTQCIGLKPPFLGVILKKCVKWYGGRSRCFKEQTVSGVVKISAGMVTTSQNISRE